MKTRILFIDGDPVMHSLVSEILVPAGYLLDIVQSRETGETALAEGGSWDLAILDVLPDNREALQMIGEIKRRFPKLPILALAGADRPASNTSFLPTTQVMGADRTLRKPFTDEMLLLAVRLLLKE